MIESGRSPENGQTYCRANTRLLTDVRVGGRGRREAVPRLAFVSGLIRRKATDRDNNRPGLSVQMRLRTSVPATAISVVGGLRRAPR